jgi:hypothetical protein
VRGRGGRRRRRPQVEVSGRSVLVRLVVDDEHQLGHRARIKAEFDEHKFLDVDYRTMPMKRSQKAMSTRWDIIHASVNFFHGFHSEVENREDSGTNVVDLVRLFLPPVYIVSFNHDLIVFCTTFD